MSFDDRMRESFRRADASIPARNLDFQDAIDKGRHQRMVRMTGALVIAAVLGVGGIFAARSLQPAPVDLLPPAGGDSRPPSPEPTPDSTASSLTPPDNVKQGDCSAAREARPISDQPTLPDEVRHMRANIVFAAWNCDYDELEKLTGVSVGETFSYSFGQNASPADYWRRLETSSPREDITAALVKVMSMDYKKEHMELDREGGLETLYMWPRASALSPSEDDWDELVSAGLYSQEQVNRDREFGQYFGYRVAILPNGDWIYFVAGD